MKHKTTVKKAIFVLTICLIFGFCNIFGFSKNLRLSISLDIFPLTKQKYFKPLQNIIDHWVIIEIL
jgi:hypothetical protein